MSKSKKNENLTDKDFYRTRIFQNWEVASNYRRTFLKKVDNRSTIKRKMAENV